MSDNVNDFGLGSENTQDTPSEPKGERTDQLAHGLGQGSGEGTEEEYAEGGRHNRLEHGLGGAGYSDANLGPDGGERDPLKHGLGNQGS